VESLAAQTADQQNAALLKNSQASQPPPPSPVVAADVKNISPATPSPTTPRGFLGLPYIAPKYEPFIILGAMLTVPILTVSVLKGCWMMVDFFVPPAGAPVPNNYAQRKMLMHETAGAPPPEVEVCTQ